MSPGPQRFDKYELRELLGRTATIEVWKAFDSQLHRYVTLKILHTQLQNDPEFVTRFQQQAQAIASLHHPNIVQIHDVHVLPVEPASNILTACIVMQFVEGASLTNYIGNTSRRSTFPPVGDIIHLFASIGSAIDYAHQHGVIHGGLRPSNILLDRNNTMQSPIGEPVLTDFGMNTLLGNAIMLLASSSIDNVAYVSPEQARGQPASQSSDLYALGVLLFEVCTGALPFQGNNPSAVIQQHINATPRLPSLVNPNVPPELDTVILRSLAKDPAARFPSASSLVAALAQALDMPVPLLSIPQAGIPHPSTFSTSPLGDPTYVLPSGSSPLAGATPSSSSLQIVKDSTPPPATFVPTSRWSASQPKTIPLQGAEGLIDAPQTPLMAPTPPPSPQDHRVIVGAGLAPTLASGPPAQMPVAPGRKSRRRGIAIALLALCVVLLLGSVLGGLLLLTHNTGSTSQTVGNAFFISSEQSNGNSTQGINDKLLLKLNNIPTPDAGKSYYAWLLSDKGKSPVTTVYLGKVMLNHGSASIAYSGDLQHTNLLASYSRILITEENANILPTSPSQDQHIWRYYAELSQITNPKDTAYHLSMLSHLRYLLVSDPRLDQDNQYGGLDIGFYRNVQSILTWAGSARDYWGDKGALQLMQNQFIRILDYIDGNAYIQLDVPQLSGTSPVVDTPVGLLGPSPATPTSFSYVSEMSGHLKAIAQASTTTANQRKLANQLISAIDNVQRYLQSVRQDAKALINMNAQQLLSQNALNTLDDMEDQALYAYVGQLNPVTNIVEEGVIQIHESIQHLAAFTITAY